MPAKKKVIKTKQIETVAPTSTISIGNIIAIIVVIALIGFGASYLSKFSTAQKPAIQTVSGVQSINYDCPAGQTALAVLKETNTVQAQDSSMGLFVDTINGTTNTDNSFWIFYVNGQMGQVGADQYTCQAGDKIEWRFEKIL